MLFQFRRWSPQNSKISLHNIGLASDLKIWNPCFDMETFDTTGKRASRTGDKKVWKVRTPNYVALNCLYFICSETNFWKRIISLRHCPGTPSTAFCQMLVRIQALCRKFTASIKLQVASLKTKGYKTGCGIVNGDVLWQKWVESQQPYIVPLSSVCSRRRPGRISTFFVAIFFPALTRQLKAFLPNIISKIARWRHQVIA